MPYTFEVAGWMDEDDNRHRFDPPVVFTLGQNYSGSKFWYPSSPNPDLPDYDEVFGLLLSVKSTDDPEDEKYFWIYDYGTFESWDEWYVYAIDMMDIGYGLDLA